MKNNTSIKMRTCLGCREEKEKVELVRLVAGPDGSVVIDYKGNLPGRGGYLCPKKSCIENAFAKGQISRALEGCRDTVENFFAKLREKILERVESLISISRKAGKVVDGREAVERGMDKGDVRLLILAEDLSHATIKEMTEKASRKGIKYCICLYKERLGNLLGKDERGIVGIRDEAFSSMLEREISRLAFLG